MHIHLYITDIICKFIITNYIFSFFKYVRNLYMYEIIKIDKVKLGCAVLLSYIPKYVIKVLK